MLCLRTVASALVGLLVLSGSLWSADFAEISEAEKQLTSLAGAPNAPAVILFERGHVELMEYPREVSSRFDFEARIKVLTPQGAEQFGEVEIPHSRSLRLSNFKGRTVLPDGRVVEIGDDALFESQVSRRNRLSTTRAVFPAVEPGAILDYRYTLHWDGFIDPDPWYFASSVPTLRSQVEYLVPTNLGVKPWAVQNGGVELQSEQGNIGKETLITVWAENVRPLPDEPYSLPEEDLSTRFMLVPQAVQIGSDRLGLFEDWRSTAELLDAQYDEFRGSKRAVRARAEAVTQGKTSQRAKIEALHAFVRDGIEDRGYGSVFPGDREGDKLPDVLERGWGGAVSQALLLREMLDHSGVDAKIVWVRDRRLGRLDPRVASPYWFSGALVRATVDGEEIWLDPVDEDLGPGQVSPFYEGLPAVVFDRKDPQVVTIDPRPAADNRRKAVLDLSIDDDGILSGTGRLELTGHHAWAERDRDAEAQELVDRWTEWLEERLPAVEISAVEFVDDLASNLSTVTWAVTSREEEVYGDELTWSPVAPLGPLSTPFTLDPSQRLTPVQLAWSDLDEIEVKLAWPEGWQVAQEPEPAGVDNGAGRFEAVTVIDRPSRSLTYRRHLRIDGPIFNPGQAYGELRDLYQAAADHDARPLVLQAN